MTDSTSEEDRQILNEIAGRFGAPAFIRRAKMVENAWEALIDACAQARRERLQIVGLRLAQLHALAGGFGGHAWLPDEERIPLQTLFDELQPRLRLPLAPTTSKRHLRAAAGELAEAIAMFNARWTRYLDKLDLSAVNRVRDEYNRNFLFEKECAVGSAMVARLGFQKLEMLTRDDVARQFPFLIVPRFVW